MSYRLLSELEENMFVDMLGGSQVLISSRRVMIIKGLDQFCEGILEVR